MHPTENNLCEMEDFNFVHYYVNIKNIYVHIPDRFFLNLDFHDLKQTYIQIGIFTKIILTYTPELEKGQNCGIPKSDILRDNSDFNNNKQNNERGRTD